MKILRNCLIALLIAAPPLSAAPEDTEYDSLPFIVSATGNTHVEVPLFKSKIVRLASSVKRISVGNPEIGDLLIIGSRQIYVVGKSLGTTNVVLWDRNDEVIGTLNVEVTHDLDTLKSKLHELLPGEAIRVHSSNGSIVLKGEVTSVDKVETAVKLAETFLKKSKESDNTLEGSVLNLMQVGGSQQVMLSVKVAEISRSLLRRLDIKFDTFFDGNTSKLGAVNGGASFPDAVLPDDTRVPLFNNFDDGTIGPAVGEYAPGLQTITDTGIFARYLSGDYLFNIAIDAAKNQGLAKVLAEPTLTAMTGQEARILSGGEFPIPVAQELGRTTIEYKEFGVLLKFLPVVLDSGSISLKVNVSVSDVTTDNSLSLGTAASAAGPLDTITSEFVIPALVKRSATSTVQLKNGETMGIAGIISENLRENVDKLPGLGELPVLGALFRSQEFIKGQTELVIFVTPRLAKSIDPEDIRLPTDHFVEPSEAEFYLMGRLEGKRKDEPVEKSAPIPTSGGPEGRFGHDL